MKNQPAASTDASARSDIGYRWAILGIVYLAFLAQAVVFQSVPPILGSIAHDLGLSHADAGLLMSLFAVPGVFLSIPAGMLADRYDARRLVGGCLAALLFGTILVAAGPSFPLLALGRLIAGAGGLSLFIVGAQVVSHWFAGRELGVAVGAYTTAMPVGTLIALGALGPVASNVGWRLSLLGGVGLSAVALAAFAVLYRRAPTPTEQRAHSLARPLRSVVPSLPVAIWLLGFIWMLFNVAAISFLTFGPDYFLARGYGVEVAGLLAAILMLLSPPLAPLVGHLLDRLGHAEWFVGIGGLLVAGSIFALSTTDYPPIVLLLLLSLGTAIVPTPVFALPPQILRPQQLGIAYGAISTFLNVGIVLGPYVTGLARDLTGGYRLSLDLMSVAALLVTILAGVLVLVRGRAGRASGRDRPAPGLS